MSRQKDRQCATSCDEPPTLCGAVLETLHVEVCVRPPRFHAALCGALLLISFAGAAHAQEPPPAPTPAPQPRPDEDQHTSFLRWLHTDVMWVPTESGNATYGLIVVHLAVARIGGLDIQGPPGVILLRQRTEDGWMLRPGMTWGLSFRLTDFELPHFKRAVTMYANLSRVWTGGDSRMSMNLAGISLTWKR